MLALIAVVVVVAVVVAVVALIIANSQSGPDTNTPPNGANSPAANTAPVGAATGQLKKDFCAAPGGAATTPCPADQSAKGALTEAEAQAAFDHFKNDRKDIPFDYPVDCCFTRAQQMIDDPMMQGFKSRGVPLKKAWNYGNLHVETPNGMIQPDGTRAVDWGYHVAPVVPVRGADGIVRDMVIDPSMETGPVTPEVWAEHQKRNKDDKHRLEITPSDPYYYMPAGYDRTDPEKRGTTPPAIVVPPASPEKVQRDLENHRRTRDALKMSGRL